MVAWRRTNDWLDSYLMAQLQGLIILSLEVASPNAHCQRRGDGGSFLCLGTMLGPFRRPPAPAPKARPACSLQMLAWLSGSGTFAVYFGKQLAQWPLHLPGAVDEGRHHPEQLVLVLLPDHRDGLQDELHLLQLVSPWGGKHQMVTVLSWMCDFGIEAPKRLQEA